MALSQCGRWDLFFSPTSPLPFPVYKKLSEEYLLCNAPGVCHFYLHLHLASLLSWKYEYHNRCESWWIRPPILSWTTQKLRLRYDKHIVVLCIDPLILFILKGSGGYKWRPLGPKWGSDARNCLLHICLRGFSWGRWDAVEATFAGQQAKLATRLQVSSPPWLSAEEWQREGGYLCSGTYLRPSR